MRLLIVNSHLRIELLHFWVNGLLLCPDQTAVVIIHWNTGSSFDLVDVSRVNLHVQEVLALFHLRLERALGVDVVRSVPHPVQLETPLDYLAWLLLLNQVYVGLVYDRNTLLSVLFISYFLRFGLLNIGSYLTALLTRLLGHIQLWQWQHLGLRLLLG